jgi:tetratricopeptide (TPR) repeat protein
MPTDDWEARLDAVWQSFDGEDEALVSQIEELVAALPPGDPVGAFELAGAHDSLGHEGRAVPLYRDALAAGLDGVRRRRATIQLASSLRNVGEVEEAVALLREERQRGSDELDDAVDAFLALALASNGEEREALSLALGALATHLPRYQRSLANYARALRDP